MMNSIQFLNAANNYEHFDFGSPIISLSAVIVAIMIGVMASAVVSFVDRNILGKFVRAINRNGCNCAENAKTVSELGFADFYGKRRFRNRIICKSLERGLLQRIVSSTMKDEYIASLLKNNAEKGSDGMKKKDKIHYFKSDITVDKYYIPEEKAASAASLFDKRGNGIVSLVICLVFCVAIGSLLISIVPWLIGLFDSAM